MEISIQNGIQENKTEKMNISDSYIHRTLVNQNALLRDNQQYAQFKVNDAAPKSREQINGKDVTVTEEGHGYTVKGSNFEFLF